jgi:L-rhamnose isomerase
VNPNLFQDDVYRFGSLCHFDNRVRKRAIEHVLECTQIAQTVGSDIISLWLADGTNYAGQDDLRQRRCLCPKNLVHRRRCWWIPAIIPREPILLQAAYETDVRPLLSEARARQGIDPDPIAAFRSSGYAERVAHERIATATSSGYPGA